MDAFIRQCHGSIKVLTDADIEYNALVQEFYKCLEQKVTNESDRNSVEQTVSAWLTRANELAYLRGMQDGCRMLFKLLSDTTS